jgi:hypothetical protein
MRGFTAAQFEQAGATGFIIVSEDAWHSTSFGSTPAQLEEELHDDLKRIASYDDSPDEVTVYMTIGHQLTVDLTCNP